MAEPVKIRITSEADLSGFDKINRAFDGATRSADQFVQAVKAGVGIDLGGRLVSSIAAIPGILQNALARGIAFNNTIGDAQVAITNLEKRFRGLDDAAAKAEAAKAIEAIKKAEPDAAGGLEDLVRGFLAVRASAAQSNATITDTVSLVAAAANTLSNLSIPAEQLPSELRMLMAGNITSDSALGKFLEVKPAQIEQWKQAGTLVSEIITRLGVMGQSGDTSAVRISSLGSAITTQLGAIAKPATEALNRAIVELTADIKAMPASAKGELAQFGKDLASLVAVGADLSRWFLQHPGQVLAVATAVGKLGGAWAAVKLASLIAGLGVKGARLVAARLAIDAETTAVVRNSAAWATNATARTAAGRAGVGAATGAAATVGAAGAGAAGVAVGAAATAARGATLRAIGGRLLGLAGRLAWQVGIIWAAMEVIDAVVDRGAEKNATTATPEPPKASPDSAPSRRSLLVPDRQTRLIQLNRGAEEHRRGVELSETVADALAAGRDGAAQLDFARGRVGELRRTFQLSYGLREDFAPEEAGRAIETSKGDEEEKKAMIGHLRELVALQKELDAHAASQAEKEKKAADDAKEKADQRQSELVTMQLLRDITEAEINGNERLKIELEAQLRYKQQMDQLKDLGFTEAEASAEAKKTAQLQKQLALRQLASQQAAARERFDDLKPAIGAEATGTGGKGGTMRREAKADFAARVEKGIADMGIDPNSPEGSRLFGEKMDRFDSAMRTARGRIDGRAPRSPLDRMGGFANLGDVTRKDYHGALAGKHDWTDFDAAFDKKKPFGSIVQTSPANASQASAETGNRPGAATGGSDGGAKALTSAAEKLDAAVTQVNSAANSLGNAASVLGTAMVNLESRVSSLEAQVASIPSKLGSGN